MITCIKCGGFISHDSSNLSSLCTDCAGKIVDALSGIDLTSLASVGITALIDEATGYQKERPQDDLQKLHKKGGRK